MELSVFQTLASSDVEPERMAEAKKETPALADDEEVLSEDEGAGTPTDADASSELQDVKIKTMYRMVEEVGYNSGRGRREQATFLYLTNKQAQAIGVQTIPRLLEEMGLNEYAAQRLKPCISIAPERPAFAA